MKRLLIATLLMGFDCSLAQEAETIVPCTVASSECTEWVAMPGSDSRALVYRSYSLSDRNEEITHAFIMVHGGARNADDYYRTGLAPTFLAGRLQDTVVIAPRFAGNNGDSCTDDIAENELNFPCDQPVSWRVGSHASNDVDVTSFDVVDEILEGLANKSAFPNLAGIVVAGHSAGGQFVSRYQMANTVHDELGLPITYVAANSGFYVYLDELRPTEAAFPANVAAEIPVIDLGRETDRSPAFESFSDAANCTSYNDWPFGLQNRYGYSARHSDETLRKQLAERPMVFLLGALDVQRFHSPCPRSAQGPNRLGAGLAYGKYLAERHGVEHEVIVVGGCGHYHRCMYSSDMAGSIIFPAD